MFNLSPFICCLEVAMSVIKNSQATVILWNTLAMEKVSRHCQIFEGQISLNLFLLLFFLL